MTRMNRESYLNAGVAALGRDVFSPANYLIPADLKVTCGWPSSRSMSAKSKSIGQCFPRVMSAANVNEIFISPAIADSVDALDVLTHEIIHAIDNCENGHRAPFKRIALAVGLTGKMTATHAGEELKSKLEAIADELGDYPHAEISTSSRKKQTTRMIKIECTNCRAVWRMARSWAVQTTCCPVCASDNIHIDNEG